SAWARPAREELRPSTEFDRISRSIRLACAYADVWRDKQGWLSLAMTDYKLITQYAVARKTQRRIGHSHHRPAGRHKPQWRCFWRMVDVANGLGQRHSRFENS